MNDSHAGTRSLRDVAAPIGPVFLEEDRRVTGITADSREVQPGFVFVAVPGTETDGHAFVEDAVARGAVAVVAQRDPGPLEVPVLRVPDARRALAELADAWFGHPASELPIVGITGSMGKTSMLTFLEAILTEAGLRVAAIGSEIIGIRVQDDLDLPTRHTTPDPMTLHGGLRRALDEDADIACMEVSSHGIDQERVHGLQFAVGIFSNLVPLEHQDYHGSFEEYVRVKCRFYDYLRPDAPLIYGIDSERLREALPDRENPRIGCGFDEQADVRITDLRMTPAGTAFRLEVRTPIRRRDGTVLDPCAIPVTLSLLGRPHVVNSAFAAAAALYLGADGDAVQRALPAFSPPERRMQLLEIGGVHVLDDTAAHPNSVEVVFDVVEGLSPRRLHVVVAIRGKRGALINSQLAAALGRCHQRRPFDTLLVTDSVDTVDELNEVADDEREVYLEALRQHDAPVEHVERLEDALSAVLERVEAGDLLVLLGPQGMHAGAGMLRSLAEGARP